MREEVTRGGMPGIRGLYYPVAKNCPQCGSPSFTPSEGSSTHRMYAGNSSGAEVARMQRVRDVATPRRCPPGCALAFVVLGCLLAGGGLLATRGDLDLYTRGDFEMAIFRSDCVRSRRSSRPHLRHSQSDQEVVEPRLGPSDTRPAKGCRMRCLKRPVILILFDASHRRAYWLHVQAYFRRDSGRPPKRGTKRCGCAHAQAARG